MESLFLWILHFEGGYLHLVRGIRDFTAGILHLTPRILQLVILIQVFTFNTQFDVLEMVSFAMANNTFSVGLVYQRDFLPFLGGVSLSPHLYKKPSTECRWLHVVTL